MADSLDYFIANVVTQDIRKRLDTHEELLEYLQKEDSSLYCEDMDRFINGLSTWISSCNFKISLNGLEIVSYLIDRMTCNFQPYITTLLPSVIDRLGDSKDQVRSSAQDLLMKMMLIASNPQFVFERATQAFTHKSWKVKEEILKCLQRILSEQGSRNISLSKLVPHIVRLMDDSSIPVREQAVNTLVIIYQHVGEKFRSDLARKDMNPSKVAQLFIRLDEVKNSGDMIINDFSKGENEEEFPHVGGVGKRSSVPSIEPGTGKAVSNSRHFANPSAPGSVTAPQVGVDEDIFTKQFDQVTRINIFSSKELGERVTRIREVLSDPNIDWTKRVDALKELRACFLAGVKDHLDFTQTLNSLELCFQVSVKDLRSQVVREACITIAFMAQELGKEFGHFAESVLPALITLIPNSAKVMASSATISVRFILQYTHVPRIIPVITGSLSSKSSVIRKQCCEFLYQIVHTWPVHVLERHIALLQDAIKRGIGDADADARVISRKAFWSFSEHFKGQADSLLNSLDSSKQKQLIGEQCSSSSSTSLNSVGRSLASGSINNRSNKTNRSISTERGPSSHAPVRPASSLGQPISRSSADHSDDRDFGRSTQSSSAVDLVSLSDGMSDLSLKLFKIDTSSSSSSHGQQNNNYSSLRSIVKRTPSFTKQSNSLVRSCDEKTLSNAMKSARPKKPSVGGGGSSGMTSCAFQSSAERSRTRSRVGVSQSQPSSRSNSPSSRLSYITHIQPDVVPFNHTGGGGGRVLRGKSNVPKSQGNSREASPTRVYGRERRLSGQSGIKQRTRTNTGTQQRLLLQGDDLASAMSDHKQKVKGQGDNYDSDDAASEASSTCSDGSYWASGRQLTEDMSEITNCLSSGSWSDRRDGLLALQNLLTNSRTLTRSELKKVTDIFSRMFHDPHGKVFSVFMDTLIELIVIHANELNDWLYVLLTRLLNKTGSDLLASVQAKVQRALEVVRNSFSSSFQFSLLSKFLIDQTQSPNLKVKVAMLMYLHGLIQVMDPTDFSNTSDIRLAISRIITWTTEPKSVEVRKAAQAVLISLYNLNTAEFSLMLSVLPKTFQEGANRILQNRFRGSSQEPETSSQYSATSPATSGSLLSNLQSPAGRLVREGTNAESMNTEDIYNSIKQTTSDIHNLIKEDAQLESARSHMTSKPSSFFSTSSSAGAAAIPLESRVPSYLHNSTVKTTMKEEFDNRLLYNSKSFLEQESSGLRAEKINTNHEERYFHDEIKTERGDMIQEILIELSNHNDRNEERKSVLLLLMKKAREEGPDVWDEYFNAVLLMLLETFGDNDGHVRALALRVLAEFLRCQPDRFQDYMELTAIKTLEAHKDSVKEVTRAAEECVTLMARVVAPSRCHVFLKPLIECEDFPVNLAAIKMLNQVIEEHQMQDIINLLPEMVPGLLKGYENAQSSVRKASVVCLVAIYLCVGEELRPFLQDLHGSKVKLLNVYIKKALEERGSNSCFTSNTSSPTSMADG